MFRYGSVTKFSHYFDEDALSIYLPRLFLEIYERLIETGKLDVERVFLYQQTQREFKRASPSLKNHL